MPDCCLGRQHQTHSTRTGLPHRTHYLIEDRGADNLLEAVGVAEGNDVLDVAGFVRNFDLLAVERLTPAQLLRKNVTCAQQRFGMRRGKIHKFLTLQVAGKVLAVSDI